MSEVSTSDEPLLDILVSHTDAWNRHDLDALMTLFADDCVFEASGGDEVGGARYEGKREVREAFAGSWIRCRTPIGAWAATTCWVRAMHFSWDSHPHMFDGRRIEVNGCDFLTIREDWRFLKKKPYCSNVRRSSDIEGEARSPISSAYRRYHLSCSGP